MLRKKIPLTLRCGRHEDTKRRGEHAEANFLQRAVSHGIAIAKPWGDSEPYDFIVDAGGRLWRIQVKSCRRQKFGLYGYAFRAFSGTRGTKTPYTPDQIDILAAYIVPEDRWYIIPLKDLNGALTFAIHTRSLSARPRGGPPRTRDFDCYHEAWWILTGGSAPAKPV